MSLSRYLSKLAALVGSDGKIPAAGIADGAVTTAKVADSQVTAAKLHTTAVTDKLGYTPVNKAGDTMTGRLTAAGFSNTLGAASRRQVWATGNIVLTSGQTMDIIRNRGGYSRAIVEVYGQTGHGSNGYLYRMFQLSRYGLDAMYTYDQSSYTTFSLNGSSSTNDNALRISTSGNTVAYTLFVVVHYFGSETGVEFDSPAGLTKIWG